MLLPSTWNHAAGNIWRKIVVVIVMCISSCYPKNTAVCWRFLPENPHVVIATDIIPWLSYRMLVVWCHAFSGLIPRSRWNSWWLQSLAVCIDLWYNVVRTVLVIEFQFQFSTHFTSVSYFVFNTSVMTCQIGMPSLDCTRVFYSFYTIGMSIPISYSVHYRRVKV